MINEDAAKALRQIEELKRLCEKAIKNSKEIEENLPEDLPLRKLMELQSGTIAVIFIALYGDLSELKELAGEE